MSVGVPREPRRGARRRLAMRPRLPGVEERGAPRTARINKWRLLDLHQLAPFSRHQEAGGTSAARLGHFRRRAVARGVPRRDAEQLPLVGAQPVQLVAAARLVGLVLQDGRGDQPQVLVIDAQVVLDNGAPGGRALVEQPRLRDAGRHGEEVRLARLDQDLVARSLVGGGAESGGGRRDRRRSDAGAGRKEQ